MNDSDYMRMALDLAAKGRGFTSPNPMVGAVVVSGDQVVGRGYHAAAGTPHAEVNALDDAGDDARGATLYVTLEPCNHQGRTPPCTHRVLAAGIRRVVAAMTDPNPDVSGGGNDWLRAQGLTVDTGILEADAIRLNEAFVKFVTTRRPFVILKCAATLDGRIATRTGDSRWVTGPQAREYVHRLRHAVDGILVGIGTVRSDDPSLTTRLPDGGGSDPIRIILDSRLTIPPDAKVLRLESESDTVIVCSENCPVQRQRALRRQGVQVRPVAAADGGGIDLNALMDHLGEMGITSLLIEGGARVHGSALAAGIADKVNFFFAPKILGGDDGVPICRGNGPETMDASLLLADVSVQRFGPDIMVEGYLQHDRVQGSKGD
jgi:diaminohydroxyphosphoribosylaminopyrimidine deaminase/5-amino-6-(5-phosphoribosylamino)uracil reductase